MDMILRQNDLRVCVSRDSGEAMLMDTFTGKDAAYTVAG